MEKYDIVGKEDWRGRPAKRNTHGGMRVALLILGTSTFENMAIFSLAVNGITYFSGVMHFSIADAANHLTNFMATGYILSILMGILADSYLGRFKIILLASCLECVGFGILTLQAHYPNLKPPPCNLFDPTQHCTQVDGVKAIIFFFGLYCIAVGTSGVKAALPSHGADQFEDDDPKEKKQKSTFFNWTLLATCIGGAIALTFLVYMEDHKGWEWGFGISTLAIFSGVLFLVAGLPGYRIHVVQGSNALTEIIQVYVAAIRNRNLALPEDPSELYEIDRDNEVALDVEFLPHTDEYMFLNKAAIRPSMMDSKNENPWKLCTVTQVENAKILLRMVPIFGCSIIMALCLAQLQTFSIEQGSTMDTRLGSFKMPPASIPIFPIMFMIIMVPIYDQIFVPYARRYTGHATGITYLQRIGVGLFLCVLSMAAAALVEVKRKDVARKHNLLDANPALQSLPISVFWMTFQYFIFGIADMFTMVGLLEFFYSQTPKNLKSFSSCFLWTAMAIGYFMSSILINIVNRATKHTTSGGWLAGNNLNRNHLNLFYWLLAVLSLLNFLIYLVVALRYRYKPQNTDVTADSKMNEEQDSKNGSTFST